MTTAPRPVVAGPGVWDARSYDAARRRLVPSFELLYGSVAELVANLGRPDPRVLDLGCGTGLLSQVVLQRLPQARVTLFDGDPDMLARAVVRCGDAVAAAVHGDLAGVLPAGPFCAAVSSLAIHHLGDSDKQALLGRVFEVLAPGGLFVNLEQVAGSTARQEAWFAERHARTAAEAGTGAQEWAGALDRMSHDRCSPLAVQLEWLQQSGFDDVECLARDWRFAVYAGRKPLPEGSDGA